MKKTVFAASLTIALIFFLNGCGKSFKTRRFLYFGTFIDISLPRKASSQLFAILENEIKKGEKLLSVKSGITADLNRRGTIENKELADLLRRIAQAHKKTNSLFDPTVEPILQVTGFSPGSQNQNKSFDPKQIKKAIKKVGFNKILLDNDKIITGGATLNFGGCGKGYLLEKLREVILANGIRNALINAGGDILAMGKNGNKPWQVGVRGELPGTIDKILELVNLATTTSGDYENFFVSKGIRYNHIINPKTGASSQKRQVTVISKDALTADIYSTSFMLMENDAALLLADDLGIGVMIYTSKNIAVSNDIFRKYLKKE